MIPACLWFIARDKQNSKFRDRRGEVLFIDARKLGEMVDRRHRELTNDDIKKISDTYHAWRGEPKDKKYQDVPGFCKSASLEELRKSGWILTPGRFVGAEEQQDNSEQFEEEMKRLVVQLNAQTVQARTLDETIARNLKELGYGA
jgi:type I restriction enzyme M protein